MAELGSNAQAAGRTFTTQAMRRALLTPERELDLARRWRETGDQMALHELTGAHMRLAIAIAGRYRRYGLPMGDLIQEGNVGLMQAAARFEPERAVRFSTYASWWIRSAIQDYILRNWSIVRTGTTAAHKSLFFNLRRLQARLEPSPTGRLSPEGRKAIARDLDVPERDVEIMEARLSTTDRSLNAPIGEESDTEWQNLLPDEAPLPETQVAESLDAQARRRWLAGAFRQLNPREMAILRARRLADETDTLEALGDRMGISKERVRQIEHQAIKKLRAALLAAVPDPQGAGLI